MNGGDPDHDDDDDDDDSSHGGDNSPVLCWTFRCQLYRSITGGAKQES